MALGQTKNKRHIAFLILAVCFVIIDRFLKTFALTTGIEKIFIKNWLEFSLVKNNNAAFSLSFGFEMIWLAIFVTLLALAWLAYSLKQKDYFKSTILAVLIMGAVSNIFDRLAYGAVIDYFSLANLNIFNLADCLIVVSAIILVWQEFRIVKTKK